MTNTITGLSPAEQQRKAHHEGLQRGEETRALTVWQPWAFAIAENFKPTENRTRRTNYRGRLFLHAGQNTTTASPSAMELRRRNPPPATRRARQLLGRRRMLPSPFAKRPTTLALSAVIAAATPPTATPPKTTAAPPGVNRASSTGCWAT